MKVVCAYCRKAMGEKPPLEDTTISHGMCDGCYDHFMRAYQGLNLSEYLDQLGAPVFVVNPEGRIVCVNHVMAGMLGIAPRDAQGMLGGEIFLCIYSRLPEGCGQTTHCLECTIRRTVMATLETGVAAHEVPAYLTRKEGKYRVSLSTMMENGLVKVQIHSLQPEGAPG